MSRRTAYKKKINHDCYDLDYAFIKWLKERLPVFLNTADKVVDLTYHKFTINDKVLTQKEIIELMIKDVNYLDVCDGLEDDYEETLNRVLMYWSKILLYMWW